MAHYAFLDENNVVTEVITGNDEGNIDWEAQYASFRGQTCKRTSYNTRGGIYYTPYTHSPDLDQSKSFRKNYAGIGYTYDANRDAFIPPQPFPSWVINEFNCLWNAPIPYPADGETYIWNEKTQAWDILDEN